MANWVIQTAQSWLKPVYRRMKKHLLTCSVIHADETVVQVLKEDHKPATSESRMWVYATNERSGKPIRYFEYQPDRSGKHAAKFLKDFTGCLVTDGYAGLTRSPVRYAAAAGPICAESGGRLCRREQRLRPPRRP